MQGIVWNNPCPAVVSHAPGTATGAKTAAFATERHEVLGMTSLAPNPQKTVLEAPAFEVLVELALDIARQCRSLSRQVGLERGIVVFDKLIKEGAFRAMAFIDRRSNAQTDFPASRQRQHVRILAKSSCTLA